MNQYRYCPECGLLTSQSNVCLRCTNSSYRLIDRNLEILAPNWEVEKHEDRILITNGPLLIAVVRRPTDDLVELESLIQSVRNNHIGPGCFVLTYDHGHYTSETPNSRITFDAAQKELQRVVTYLTEHTLGWPELGYIRVLQEGYDRDASPFKAQTILRASKSGAFKCTTCGRISCKVSMCQSCIRD